MTRRRLAWTAAVLLAATGCGRPPPRAPSARAAASVPFGAVRRQPDAKRWLDADASKARSVGAGDAQVVKIGMGAAGDRIEGMVSVPPDSCTLLVARGAKSVEDVDLFAYTDDGTVLGSDEAPDATPSVLVCPPHTRYIYVVARVAAGSGLVAIGAQRVRPADAARVGQALGAHGRPGEAHGRIEAWPGLDAQLAEHRRLIGATWQEVRQVAVPVDPRVATHLSAMVDRDRCLDVLVVPSDEVSHLELAVLASDGHTVGRAVATGRDRSLVVCSPASEPITIEIRPHVGRGLVAVVLSRTAPHERPDANADVLSFDLAPVGDLADTRAKNESRLEASGYPKAKVLGRGQLVVGRRVSVDLDIPEGCSRLDVLSGRPVRGIDALLWKHDGTLIAHTESSGQATLFACGHGDKARLDLEATVLPGPYAVELRPDRDAAAPLADHPLAASRLLARMTSRGIVRAARQVPAPKAVSLSATTLQHEDLLVPVGRCVDVTLALGAGASGAELRLVDAADGREVALARSAWAASARACAIDASTTLHVRAEMRVTAGSTTGLFATRMLAPRP